MLFRFLLYSFLLTMALRFVMRYVLPFLQGNRDTGSRLRNLQDRVDAMEQQAAAEKRAKSRKGDYIEYEEVR